MKIIENGCLESSREEEFKVGSKNSQRHGRSKSLNPGDSGDTHGTFTRVR